ncbi:MAG: hypothetical protein KDD55_09860 [Bdellovibrionales bacterium]|nr:hypothetical protein [Bdellovibrionales bacterium]
MKRFTYSSILAFALILSMPAQSQQIASRDKADHHVDPTGWQTVSDLNGELARFNFEQCEYRLRTDRSIYSRYFYPVATQKSDFLGDHLVFKVDNFSLSSFSGSSSESAYQAAIIEYEATDDKIVDLSLKIRAEQRYPLSFFVSRIDSYTFGAYDQGFPVRNESTLDRTFLESRCGLTQF